MYAGYILYYMGSNRFFCGAPLDVVAETLRGNTTFNEKLKNTNGIDVQLGLSHALANLRGEPPEPFVRAKGTAPSTPISSSR